MVRGVWCSAAASDIEIGAHSRAHMAVVFEGEESAGLSGPIPVAWRGAKKEVSQLASVGLFGVEGKFATQRGGKEEGIVN